MSADELIDPEVAYKNQAIQDWVLGYIVQNNFCPPLTHLANHCKGNMTGGQVDRSMFFNPRMVDIEVLKDSESTSTQLEERYVSFMEKAIYQTSDSPFSTIFVLPDFRSNQDYDLFALDFKYQMADKLLGDHINLVEDSFVTAANLGRANDVKLVQPTIDYMHSNPNSYESRKLCIDNIIEGMFRLVYFYGKPLSDANLIGFSDERGPITRFKALSAAPFYLFQVVNLVKPFKFIESLDRPQIHRDNTLKASQIAKDPNTVKKTMTGFRRRK